MFSVRAAEFPPLGRRCAAIIGALLVLAVVPSAASATALPEKITENMTLTAVGNPYTGGSVTIEAGATLKIEKDVKLMLTGLTVKGTLDVNGTAEEPVVFTTPKVGESWHRLIFEPGSGGSVIDHAEIVRAGGGLAASGAIEIKNASPSITNSIVRESQYGGIKVLTGGAPVISGNEILGGGNNAGIWFSEPSQSGEVNVTNNYIDGGRGIRIEAGSKMASGAISGNTITNTLGEALVYEGSDIPDLTNNTIFGNVNDLIVVNGTVTDSVVWGNPGVPIETNQALTIAGGATLKIGAGTLLHPTKSITVKGTLDVNGTAEEPVVFTTPKVGESWQRLIFEPGSGASSIDHAEIVRAGGGLAASGAIEIKNASPSITNSIVRESQYGGIKVLTGGAPVISGNEILGGGNNPGIWFSSPTEPGEVNVTNNYIDGTRGIYINVGSKMASGAISGNTITNTNGEAAIVYEGSDVPNLTNNTIFGNVNDLILVSGTVSDSIAWSDPGVPIKMNTTLTIASGASLDISQGVYLINPNLTVKGTLDAGGTAAKPVVFTGPNETTAGEWKSIVFEAGSGESRIDHAEVAYGGSTSGNGMIEAKGSHPQITNTTIRKSKNYGIKVTSSGAPKIEWNRFRGNTNGISYSGTGNLVSANNDWGCASGPKPSGCGDSVTSNVSWKPAVQLPEMAGHCRGGESQCGEGADPVSLATGHLSYSHRDLLLTNKGDVPLEFTRAYSSGSSADTGLGPGWSQTGLASATELESGDVLILRQDGRQDLFLKTAEGGYNAPSGLTSTLAKVEGTFQLTTLENTVYRFDASGRIASITDNHGLKTTYGYNAEGRLATITDPSSQTLTFSYNASNHITSVKDSTGREVKYTYSAAGDLATVTDALGGVTEYTYDSAHRLKTIKDPRGNVILKNTYDSQGRVVEQLDGLENLWELEYKENETVVTEPEGGKVTYGFDGQDRVISEKDQLGHTTTTSYDEAGNVDEIVKPGGAKWQFGHDSKGNLTSVIDPEEGERSYEYDAKNRLESFTDEREEIWAYEWDEDNDLVKITDPAEGETTFTHDAAGLPLAVTDPNEHTTTFSYDSRGNRLTVEDALEHTTTFAYNSRNQLTSKTAPGLEPETYSRNVLGDLLSVTTPEGNKTEYVYDANGLPTQITDPAENVWKIAYNAMARPITYTDPLEQQTTVSYDGNLKPTKITNRRGKETTYDYDLANRVTEVHGPEGWDWTFGYDARGNRTSVIDPRENGTTYDYDLLDRMTEASEPLAVTTEYGYDANGNLTSVTDPRGNTTSYGYDDLGRLVAVAQPLEKTTLYTYDGVGNVLTRSTAAGMLEYEYDAADRLREVADGEATLRVFGYDNADRLTAATDAQGKKIEIAYNEDGRVSSINDGRGQSLTRGYDPRGYLTKQVDGRGTLEYEYDKLGRLTSLTDPQAKSSTFAYDAEGGLTEVKRPGGIVTTNVYDDAGRLSETTTEAGEPAAVLEALEYAYDPAGNVVKRIDSRLEQETTFGYDELNRLTEFNSPGEGSTAYGYDAAGNRISAGGTTYSYNALNQLTGASDGSSYGYDGVGRLTSIAKGEEETTYEWDPLDHLDSVEGPSGTASYVYDALDRLSEQTTGSGTTVTHYGDLTDLPTYDITGETTTSYVSGAQGLLKQHSGEATSYPLRDAHGDVTAVANAAGEVTSRPSYDPWGVQLSGPTVDMGYLGAQQRRFDPTSGLIQMGARSYSPALGRFMTEDPVLGHLGVGASFDRYAYAWDNPLNLYDLDGRDVCVPTPFGDACAEDAAEDIGNAAGDAAGTAGSAAERAWNWTQPGRAWVSERAQDFVKSDVGQWIDDRANDVERTFTCIAERVVQQPGPVRCQEEAEQWKPEPEAPEVPPSLPPPSVPGKDLLPNVR